MKYNNINPKNRIPILHAVLTILIFLFSVNFVQSQVNESELKAGDSIYVVTNRHIDTTIKNLSFNSEVNESKGLTYLKIKKSPSGETISHILSYDEFLSQITQKTSDWLLFIHGDSKTYQQSIKRGFDIQQLYKVNVIVFSWPSKLPDATGLKNLNNSKRNVLKSMPHFHELLAFMDAMKKSNHAFSEKAHISLLLHSLGNLYLNTLAIEPHSNKRTDPIFNNVIINSAAVEQKMHANWVEKINFQQRIYITNNKSDFNLKGKHIFSKDGNQLGEKAKAPLAVNANYVQFSKAVGFRFPTGTSHTYFIGDVTSESQNIREFYFNAVHGNLIDFSDQSQFIKHHKDLGYDVLF